MFAMIMMTLFGGSENVPTLGLGRVDYWRSRKESRPKEEPKPTSTATLWAEPVRMPDGRYATYLPPPQVLQFLENPTPETARGYLDWQRERLAKLRRAAELLGACTEDGKETARGEAVELLYFKQLNCAYCKVQDRILTEIRRARPDVAIREVSRDRWKEYGVELSPTLIVSVGGKPQATFRGLASRERILSTLEELSPHDR